MTVTAKGRRVDFEKLPKQLSRAKNIDALYETWRKTQKLVCSPTVLRGMPRAIEHIATQIYETPPHMAAEAIRMGDSALFVAILMRLAQIDAALVAAGRTLDVRSPIIYAKHVVEGFRMVADEAFVELGGTPL
jgi:hypothetical protein